jgi:hypothetical protein
LPKGGRQKHLLNADKCFVKKEKKMGILDSIKKAATDSLSRTAVKSTEAIINKAAALVGSKVAGTVSKTPASTNAEMPAYSEPPVNAAAAAKAASLVGSMAEPAVTELSYAEVEAIIEAKVREKGRAFNWRYSIVDFMTVLGMNNSLASRKEIADKLGYSGYDADGSAEKNNWLHAELMNVLARNGGELPSYLL